MKSLALTLGVVIALAELPAAALAQQTPLQVSLTVGGNYTAPVFRQIDAMCYGQPQSAPGLSVPGKTVAVTAYGATSWGIQPNASLGAAGAVTITLQPSISGVYPPFSASDLTLVSGAPTLVIGCFVGLYDPNSNTPLNTRKIGAIVTAGRASYRERSRYRIQVPWRCAPS